jgi:5-(carboxyamino)imidazole ribonucleotide synthase
MSQRGGISKPILPGQTVGIYGGGQLGRMLAQVARRTGYRVHVFTPEDDSPAGHFANQVFVAPDTDEDAFRRFANSIDVLTFEFEKVSAASLEWVPERVPIRPGPQVFWTAQDRGREKAFLQKHGLPLPKFATVDSLADLEWAAQVVGLPAVLKTSAGGYDGKGQAVIRDSSELANAWQAVQERPSTLEAFVSLACEVSVIVARDVWGACGVYGPIENHHTNHILDLSVCPARVEAGVAHRACELARKVADHFELVGLICIEFFVTAEGEVLVNEIAPRPHNSGHLTIEGFAVSQFEQQLRCVCGLPLGSTVQRTPVAMANLLGDLWFPHEPNWRALLASPETYLHLYDKNSPRPGRKMGHVTVCADDVERAALTAVNARDSLGLPWE